MTYTSISEYLKDLIDSVHFLLGDGMPRWDEYNKKKKELDIKVAETTHSGGFLPFEHLCIVFNLNPFERLMLTLALALEIIPHRKDILPLENQSLTISWLLNFCALDIREVINYYARWEVVRDTLSILFGTGSIKSPVELSETLMQFILGVRVKIEGVEIFSDQRDLPEDLIGYDISKICNIIKSGRKNNLFAIIGAKGMGKRYTVKKIIKHMESELLLLPYKEIRADKRWIDDIRMYTIITGATLCIGDVPEKDWDESLIMLLKKMEGENIFITAEHEIEDIPLQYKIISEILPKPSKKAMADVWDKYLMEYDTTIDFNSFAQRYPCSIGQIENICGAVVESALIEGMDKIKEIDLQRACQTQARYSLGDMAVPVEAYFSWDDIVLPCAQVDMLKHICMQAKLGHIVYEKWGLSSKFAYGKGVKALFVGEPGTGKTMAAQVIASDLSMPLYKVNLSSLVSKYIGDTEKNLEKLFMQAEKSRGVLFFDEGDALFGKRGEQKDSNDRYANMQTAFLLQKIEEYEGVVLIATNLASNLDSAFVRRLQNRVTFPMPNQKNRKRIWKNLLLESMPVSKEINIDFLAERFEISGASIKNVVLQAAFLAAAKETAVGMAEIVKAISIELEKTNQILSEYDLDEYKFYIQER